MNMFAFSVRDNAVEAFLPVFFARSKGEAVRSFVSACDTPDHQFAKNAGDFTLFGVGSFDDSSGMLSPMEPSRIMSALEAKTPA